MPANPDDVFDCDTKGKACKLALELETCLNSKFKDTKSYADKARSLVFNLKD